MSRTFDLATFAHTVDILHTNKGEDMKAKAWSILIVVLLISSLGCSKSNEPADLLKKIHALSLQKDYEQIEQLIYPYRDGCKQAVAGIRDGDTSSDWAYSNESLGELIDNYLDKFTPIPDELLLKLFIKGGDWSDDIQLVNLAKTQPQNFTIFDYKDVHILIVKVEGEQKLLFWENLTNLARKE
jgi:hypothetical protein